MSNPMMSAESLQQVDRYWAGQLTIPPDALHSPALLVIPHPELDSSYCFVFQHRAFTCVRVPPAHYDHLRQAIDSQDRASLFTSDWWQRTLATTRLEAIGPAYLGYADAQQFRPVIRHPARLMTTADSAALATFAGEVGSLAWEHSGLGEEPQPIMGCWQEDRLVAAAGYKVWGAMLAHIGVTTHPAFLGAGYGKTVVSAIGRHALEHGLVLQYRTLLANHASIAIAEALGFQAYATTLFVALSAAITD
jgi:RimJ/RimL family protein N-acetyltransferase